MESQLDSRNKICQSEKYCDICRIPSMTAWRQVMYIVFGYTDHNFSFDCPYGKPWKGNVKDLKEGATMGCSSCSQKSAKELVVTFKSPCKDCFIKHLSSALVLSSSDPEVVNKAALNVEKARIYWTEYKSGYKTHLYMALGCLEVAEEALFMTGHSDVGEKVREARKTLSEAPDMFPVLPDIPDVEYRFKKETCIVHLLEAKREAPTDELTRKVSDIVGRTHILTKGQLAKVLNELLSKYNETLK